MIQPVFDGHNDVLLRLWQHARSGTDPVQEFVSGVPVGHIDGPRAKAGGLVGGLCAIFLPSAHIGPPPERQPPFRLPFRLSFRLRALRQRRASRASAGAFRRAAG